MTEETDPKKSAAKCFESIELDPESYRIGHTKASNLHMNCHMFSFIYCGYFSFCIPFTFFIRTVAEISRIIPQLSSPIILCAQPYDTYWYSSMKRRCNSYQSFVHYVFPYRSSYQINQYFLDCVFFTSFLFCVFEWITENRRHDYLSLWMFLPPFHRIRYSCANIPIF